MGIGRLNNCIVKNYKRTENVYDSIIDRELTTHAIIEIRPNNQYSGLAVFPIDDTSYDAGGGVTFTNFNQFTTGSYVVRAKDFSIGYYSQLDLNGDPLLDEQQLLHPYISTVDSFGNSNHSSWTDIPSYAMSQETPQGVLYQYGMGGSNLGYNDYSVSPPVNYSMSSLFSKDWITSTNNNFINTNPDAPTRIPFNQQVGNDVNQYAYWDEDNPVESDEAWASGQSIIGNNNPGYSYQDVQSLENPNNSNPRIFNSGTSWDKINRILIYDGQEDIDFSNDDEDYSIDNVVYVVVELKNNYVLSESPISNAELWDIAVEVVGDAHLILDPIADTSGTGTIAGMPLNINGEVSIFSSINNTGSETITIENDSSLKTNIVNGGFYNEKKQYKINTKNIKRNSSKKIATIKIDADTSSGYFSSSPYLESNYPENIKIKKTKIERSGTSDKFSSKRITSYTFDLIYKNLSDVSRSKEITANIIYKTKKKPNAVKKITNISFGEKNLHRGGEVRTIKISGTPLSKFYMTVKKLSSYVDSDGNTIMQPLFDESILSKDSSVGDDNIGTIIIKGNANSTMNGDSGEIDVIAQQLDSDGSYSFKQKFPSSTVKSDLVTVAKTSSTQLNINDTTGVQVGDVVLMKELTVPTTVDAVVTDKIITISSPATFALNSPVTFKRKMQYAISFVTNKTIFPLVSDVAIDNTYVLTQYLNPVLNFRASTAVATFKINGGGNGVNNNLYFSGIANKSTTDFYFKQETASTSIYRRPVTCFNLVYTLTPATGGHTFTQLRVPTLNKNKNFIDSNGNLVQGTTNSWTNTDPTLNGGTTFMISNIEISGAETDTVVIKAKVTISEWGTKDVLVDFDLDNIVTAGA